MLVCADYVIKVSIAKRWLRDANFVSNLTAVTLAQTYIYVDCNWTVSLCFPEAKACMQGGLLP